MSNAAILKLPQAERKAAPPKRRGQRGMGTVWQPKYKVSDGNGGHVVRKSSYWWIRYTDKGGVRHNENTHCTTKDGAKAVLMDRLGKVQAGTLAEHLKYSEITLHKLFADLKAQYQMKGRRSGDKLARNLGYLENHFGADTPATTITADKIEGYRVARRTSGEVKDPTINRELAALKAALRLGYKNDYVKKVPHIDIPDESHRAEDGEFSPADFETLCQHLPSYLMPLARFAYTTGMRISEPRGLQWHEVDVERGELRLHGRRTKNGQQKVLYLSGVPLEILRAQHKARKGDFVFHNNGEQILYETALNHYHEAYERSGLKLSFTDGDGHQRQPGFHDLRRSFARNARRAGVPDNVVMEIGGWKTHAMLLRYLGQTKEDEQRRAFAAMGAPKSE